MTTHRRSERLRLHDNHEPKRLRKRKNASPDVTNEGNYQPKLKRERLTARNLHKHQRETSQYKMGQNRKTPSTSTTSKASTVTTTDKLFGTRLVQNHVIYRAADTIAPDDAEVLKKELLEKRDIPRSAHKNWNRLQISMRQMAAGEFSLESSVVESMLLSHGDDAPATYSRHRNEQWTEVDNEITVGISDPKPDVTESYVWEAYPAGTPEEFDDLVVTQYGYSMPTFAMESKGPGGNHMQAVRQAAYDGALMTHAALAVDRCVDEPLQQLGRITKAITVTLSDAEIVVYANHAVISDTSGTSKITYHQYRLLRLEYLDSEDEWNRAHSVLYNAQNIALRLATSRITAITAYFKRKAEKQTLLKAKQAKLQEQARTRLKAVTKPNHPKRSRQAHVDNGKAARAAKLPDFVRHEPKATENSTSITNSLV